MTIAAVTIAILIAASWGVIGAVIGAVIGTVVGCATVSVVSEVSAVSVVSVVSVVDIMSLVSVVDTMSISSVTLDCFDMLLCRSLLLHVAHESGSFVSLVRSPASETVGLHSVATVVTIGDTVLLVFVIFVEVDERLLIVVGVGHGRAGMGVGDVMATVVITTVHGVVQVSGDNVSFCLILRLVDGAKSVLVVVELELLEVRQLGEDWLVGGLARAVWADAEEALNLGADDGPLGWVHGSLPATEIVVNEELVLVSFLALSEHWVDEEDGGLELLVSVVDRLHVEAALEERSDVWLLGKDGVLDGSASVADGKWDQRITLEMLSLLEGSLCALESRVGEVGVSSLDIAVVV